MSKPRKKIQAKAKWTSLEFGGNPIKRVTSGGFGHAGTTLEFRGGPREHLVLVSVGNCNPSAGFSTDDFNSVYGITPGTIDTLKAKLEDEDGGVQFTMKNAIFESVELSAGHSLYATGKGVWRGVANDGLTNPLSFAVSTESIVFPDALMITPVTRKRRTTMIKRVASIAKVVDPILHVDRARGERSYIRVQGDGKLFVTKWITDTILFPIDHERVGEPRYQWEQHNDGIEFGYLVKGAQ